MADTRIDSLTALTGANLASGDKLVVVDKSDTTMAASGTDKAITAAELAVGLAALMVPAWTAYTPSWTSSGTAPAIGNGTITGAWSLVGKTLSFRIKLTMGSTTTFGTGNYSFSLPGGVTSAGEDQAVVAVLFDTSAGLRAHAAGLVLASGTTVSRIAVNNAGGASNTIPWTWANGDLITINGTIEVA